LLRNTETDSFEGYSVVIVIPKALKCVYNDRRDNLNLFIHVDF